MSQFDCATCGETVVLDSRTGFCKERHRCPFSSEKGGSCTGRPCGGGGTSNVEQLATDFSSVNRNGRESGRRSHSTRG